MNPLNSCIFEGKVTELKISPAGVSFLLEIERTVKVNGKNKKEITKIPIYAFNNLVDKVEKQKPIKEAVGTVVRVVGRMSSFETNDALSLLCIAEHIDVKQ